MCCTTMSIEECSPLLHCWHLGLGHCPLDKALGHGPFHFLFVSLHQGTHNLAHIVNVNGFVDDLLDPHTHSVLVCHGWKPFFCHGKF